VEEVATLASRFGWSYEALMSMTGVERRLWLAASDRVAAGGGRGAAGAAPPGPAATPAPSPRATEAERRERLLELSQQFAARYQR
jgi:hypothetical protein